MITDEDLIDGLRDELELLHPPPELLERVRSLEAARREPSRFGVLARGSSKVWRLPRFSVANLVAGVALATTLAIAFVALTSLRGGGSQPISPAAQPLASTLSVLRRAQTAADRTLHYAQTPFASSTGGLPDGNLVSGLTRRAVTVPGLNMFVVVQRPTVWPNGDGLLWSPTLGDRVGLALVGTAGGASSASDQVPATDLDQHLRLVDGSGLCGRRGCAPTYGAEIVPDAVSRVIWMIRVKNADGSTSLVTIAPTIHDNVAYAKLPAAVVGSPAGRAWRDTWYDQGGNVIPEQIASARDAAAATVGFYRPARAVLRNFHLFTLPPRTVTDLGSTISPVSAAGVAEFGPAAQLHGAQSRSVITPPGGTRIAPGTPAGANIRARAYFSIIPTRLGACLIPRQGPTGGLVGADVGSCTTSVATLLRRGIWNVAGFSTNAGDFLAIYGIVPDTNHSITLELRGGQTRTVPVVDGVFAGDVRGVTGIEVRSASGTLATWHVASPWSHCTARSSRCIG